MSGHVPVVFLEKLAKVCALFSSNFDGERSTAALLADSMVRDAGFTWEQVLSRSGPKTRRSAWQEPHDLQSAVAMCSTFPECLSEWERRFIASVADSPSLSRKQKQVLDSLVGKARRFATMGEAA